VPILVNCECGRSFQTEDENAGRRARCPSCGRDQIISGPAAGGDRVNDLPEHHPVAPVRSGKAVASLVLSLVPCAFLTGVPAIILGALGLSDINRGGGRLKGRGMATTGIVLGGFNCVIFPILAVLVGLLLPAVQAAREAARRAQCTNNLKNIGIAMQNFQNANGAYPSQAIKSPDGKPLLSWRVALLPYLEREDLYKRFKLDEPWDSPNNKPLLAEMPALFTCPSDSNPTPGQTTYEVVVGPNTMFTGGKPVAIAEVLDGLSNTVLVVESGTPVNWTEPVDLSVPEALAPGRLGRHHPGGANILFADGSVRFLKTSALSSMLAPLLTRNVNENTDDQSY